MIILPKIKAKFFKKVESFEKLYYDPTISKIKEKTQRKQQCFCNTDRWSA